MKAASHPHPASFFCPVQRWPVHAPLRGTRRLQPVGPSSGLASPRQPTGLPPRRFINRRSGVESATLQPPRRHPCSHVKGKRQQHKRGGGVDAQIFFLPAVEMPPT
ncbi:hypothetical protein MRX96_022556 [Rhipicephalus microplus]